MQTLFKELIKDIYKLVKGKASLANKLKNLNPEQAYLTAANVEKVKTIWQIDKEVCLREFYYPTKIKVEDNTLQLDSLAELPENGKIVVQGTAGQGKSILLRYLTGMELRKGQRLPIFVELRKISNTKSLTDLILDNLNEMGLDIDSTELPHLFKTGKCVLLLDAFDEVPAAQTTQVITLIEGLCNKHHSLCILVTSRPGADIQKVAYIRVFEMAELKPDDYEPLLGRLFPNANPKIQDILEAIEASETQITALLTTPLLLTLLVIIYKSYNNIPNSLAEFYEKLFDILCFRHDSSKPGYKREFATQLPENELTKLFDAFCFFCMKAQKTAIKKSDALELVTEAKQFLEKDSVDEQHFLNDITKVTCLLVEEGFEYHFIHKSIREFHAASFIKNNPESLKQTFYTHAQKHYESYKAELSFLSAIDSFNYKKMFLLPYTNNLLLRLRYDDKAQKTLLSADEYLENLNVSYSIDSEYPKSIDMIGPLEDSILNDPFYQTCHLLVVEIFDVANQKLLSSDTENFDGEAFPASKCIENLDIENEITTFLNEVLCRIYDDKKTLQKSIKQTESRMKSVKF